MVLSVGSWIAAWLPTVAEEKSIWTEGEILACEAGNESNCSTATAVDLRDLCIESW